MQNMPSELIITVESYIYITSFKMKGSPDLGQAVSIQLVRIFSSGAYLGEVELEKLTITLKYATDAERIIALTYKNNYKSTYLLRINLWKSIYCTGHLCGQNF